MAGCTPDEPNGYVSMDVTKIVSGWTTGELPQYALELRGGSETDSTYMKRFCSRNAAPAGTTHCTGTSGVPSLSVTYVYAFGQQPHQGTVLSHKLDDRSQISVNTQDGDGVYKASDIHLNGRGLDLSVDRFFNSLNSAAGPFGSGWSMSSAPTST